MSSKVSRENMPEYKYKAIDENGNPFSDVVEADSLEMANNILIARVYTPG